MFAPRQPDWLLPVIAGKVPGGNIASQKRGAGGHIYDGLAYVFVAHRPGNHPVEALPCFLGPLREYPNIRDMPGGFAQKYSFALVGLDERYCALGALHRNDEAWETGAGAYVSDLKGPGGEVAPQEERFVIVALGDFHFAILRNKVELAIPLQQQVEMPEKLLLLPSRQLGEIRKHGRGSGKHLKSQSLPA